MTRLFTAGILTETNSFAPYPTELDGFKVGLYLRRGDGVSPVDSGDPCSTFISLAAEDGWDVVAGLRTFAQPAGPVSADAYRALRKELLDDLESAMPVDAVMLSLHGAMIADGEPDGEGDLLACIRARVGADIPIGVHLDPHCHLTERMVDNADFIRIWKEYPHTDIAERAFEVYNHIKARLSGEPRLIPVVHSCHMAQVFHTTREPMRSFVDKVTALEGHNGVQSISIVHSFPWGDTADMGTKILVYVDDTSHMPHATRLAQLLGDQLWKIKESAGTPYLGLDDALDQAFAASEIPVIISDGADNPGGGAPCDSTYFLARLLERDDANWAVGYLYDPDAVKFGIRAGNGSHVEIGVGGKTCALSGDTISIAGKVSGIVENAKQAMGPLSMPSGSAVGIDLGKNRHIALIDKRVQTFSYSLFEQLGIDLSKKQAVIVKSSQHFFASFSDIAARILYANVPGVVTTDFKTLPYRNADTTMWPLSDEADG